MEAERMRYIDDMLFLAAQLQYGEFKPTDEMPPVLTVFKPDVLPASLDIEPLMRSEVGKDVLAKLITGLARSPEVEVVALIAESWLITRQAGELPSTVAPADSPDRVEVLIFAYTFKDGGAFSHHKIVRGEVGVHLERGDLMFTDKTKLMGRFISSTDKDDGQVKH